MHKVVKKLWLPSVAAIHVGAVDGGGGGPADIFTPSAGALNADDENPNNTFRVVATVAAASNGQVRVTFNASSTKGLAATHCAIGKRTGAQSDCTAVPLELKFGGSSGFSLSPGGAITSDWLDHSGSFSLAINDVVVVIVDCSTPGGQRFRGSNSNVFTRFKDQNQSWDHATESETGGGYANAGTNACWVVSKIETGGA